MVSWWSSEGTARSLKGLELRGKKKSLPVFADGLCAYLGHAFNTQPDRLQLCSNLHFLCRADHQPKVRVQGLLGSFLSICPALGICMISQIPRNMWQLFKSLFSKASHTFPPRLLELSVLSPNCQETASNTFAFKCFWRILPGQLPQLWEFSELGEIRQTL